MAEKSFAIFRVAKVHAGAFGKVQNHAQNRQALKNRTHPELEYKNKIFCAKKDGKELSLSAAFKAKTKGIKVRRDSVCLIECMYAFSPEQQRQIESIGIGKWANKNLAFTAAAFGGAQNIVRAQIDYDEKTPHMHVWVVPIDSKGHLNASEYINGRKALSMLQDSYADCMRQYGLDRGVSYYKAGRAAPRHETIGSYWNRQLQQQVQAVETQHETAIQLQRGNVQLAQKVIEWDKAKKAMQQNDFDFEK